ncbi:hypothetical protein QVD17_17887 [Tagetes erecta]|uniref:Uncharacterized protein n=1 Tax=Tagetes erecta TaxID=13708 RepID=A0AAD8KGH3_TARER|nr:hypothetical protein QVD17_17887 [Tagetes erecta]
MKQPSVQLTPMDGDELKEEMKPHNDDLVRPHQPNIPPLDLLLSDPQPVLMELRARQQQPHHNSDGVDLQENKHNATFFI